METFLASQPSCKTLMSASPRDVARFLVWKDKDGRTKVHTATCPFIGSTRKAACSCPTRLAAGTVDSMIGKLRAMFAAAGRGNDWSEVLGVGNPAAHECVKSYLRLIREEQAQAMIKPKQAIPLFFEKLVKLCTHIRSQIFAPKGPPSQRYILARDAAFFCLDFYAGDRASDLGRIHTREITAPPGRDMLLFRHTFGKTLRGQATNTFMVKRCEDPRICPVNNLELYMELCDLMAINLRDGYLFRTLDSTGKVSALPFSGSAVANRLSLHLTKAGINEGESMHSFRSGCSITLSLLGVSPEEVAGHVGWRSVDTCEYYLQTRKVMKARKVATTLADSTSARAAEPAEAASVGTRFHATNDIKNFSMAFP